MATGTKRSLTLVVAGVFAAVAAASFAATAAAADLTITTNTTLTADVNGTIFVGADGVTLDCAGHRVTAGGWAAIDLTGRSGVTVKNCRVGGGNVGIWLNGSSGNRIIANTATGSANAGIYLYNGSSGNLVSGNTASGNGWYGIWLQASSNDNTVSGNTASSNPYSGIFVIFGSRNTLTGNTADANGGAPAGPLDAGQGFYLFGADRTTLRDNSATANVSDGFQLRGSTQSTLTGNDGSANGRNGFGLFEGSNGNTLSRNTANGGTASPGAGFWLQDSSDNQLSENTASGNSYDGLIVINAHGKTTVADSVGNNNGAYGFDANRCSGVTFANDSAARNTFGGFFNILSSGTTYTGNVAHDNGGAPVGPLDEGEGFYLYETDATSMTGNQATSNVTDGFQLRGATHTVIRDNQALGNDRIGFGLFADDFGAPSTGNTVASNLGRGNKLLDAEDTSSARSNSWTGNNFGSVQLP